MIAGVALSLEEEGSSCMVNVLMDMVVVIEVWSSAETTAAGQAPLRGCREARVVRRPGTEVIGKLKCVRCSMCRLMMMWGK